MKHFIIPIHEDKKIQYQNHTLCLRVNNARAHHALKKIDYFNGSIHLYKMIGFQVHVQLKRLQNKKTHFYVVVEALTGSFQDGILCIHLKHISNSAALSTQCRNGVFVAVHLVGVCAELDCIGNEACCLLLGHRTDIL